MVLEKVRAVHLRGSHSCVIRCERSGLGACLYEDMFSHARTSSIPVVTCEYNLVPPNEASRLFHEKFGFKEQGTQWVTNGAKRVSLQAAET